jgi:hypothetical protein
MNRRHRRTGAKLTPHPAASMDTSPRLKSHRDRRASHVPTDNQRNWLPAHHLICCLSATLPQANIRARRRRPADAPTPRGVHQTPGDRHRRPPTGRPATQLQPPSSVSAPTVPRMPPATPGDRLGLVRDPWASRLSNTERAKRCVPKMALRNGPDAPSGMGALAAGYPWSHRPCRGSGWSGELLPGRRRRRPTPRQKGAAPASPRSRLGSGARRAIGSAAQPPKSGGNPHNPADAQATPASGNAAGGASGRARGGGHTTAKRRISERSSAVAARPGRATPPGDKIEKRNP